VRYQEWLPVFHTLAVDDVAKSALNLGARGENAADIMARPATASRAAAPRSGLSPRFSKCSPVQLNRPTTPNRRCPAKTATVMLVLGVGLGLLRSIDPSIPVNGLVDILRLVSGQT
jgi:hypothetical protein